MDENKQYILNELYKHEIAKLTKEDFEFVRNKVVEYAINQYENVIFKSGVQNGETRPQA